MNQPNLVELRCATAGSVDDGKSTLIGRLLFDANVLMDDQLTQVADVSRRRGWNGIDLSLLTDGLRAEREQGITIDVAWRYFATPKRRFTLADSPGHVEYTRNMFTAASQADAVIVVVDARRGISEQTLRHISLALLVRVEHVIVAINKMDLVDYSEEVYRLLEGELQAYAHARGSASRLVAVPIAALTGENVSSKAERMAWYESIPLLAVLETLPVSRHRDRGAVRLPIQCALRENTGGAIPRTRHGSRAYAGRLRGGALWVGDRVTVLPKGSHAEVVSITIGGEEVTKADVGRSVAVELSEDLDVGRGDVLVGEGGIAPTRARSLVASAAWLGDELESSDYAYLVKHGHKEVRAQISGVVATYDVPSGRWQPVSQDRPVRANDICRLRIRLSDALFVDSYASDRATGSALLIDPASGRTVAGLMIEPDDESGASASAV